VVEPPALPRCSGDTIFDQTNSFTVTHRARRIAVYFDALTNKLTAKRPVGRPQRLAGLFSHRRAVPAVFLPESGTTRERHRPADGRLTSVADLNVEATNLVFGSITPQTLSPAFRTDLYRFSARMASGFYYDALEYDGDAVGVQLINPSAGLFSSR